MNSFSRRNVVREKVGAKGFGDSSSSFVVVDNVRSLRDVFMIWFLTPDVIQDSGMME